MRSASKGAKRRKIQRYRIKREMVARLLYLKETKKERRRKRTKKKKNSHMVHRLDRKLNHKSTRSHYRFRWRVEEKVKVRPGSGYIMSAKLTPLKPALGVE